jgi:hypothetical protein
MDWLVISGVMYFHLKPTGWWVHCIILYGLASDMWCYAFPSQIDRPAGALFHPIWTGRQYVVLCISISN